MSSIPTNAELEEQLRTSIAQPAEASNETGSVKQHSLKDRLEAQEYLERKAVTNPFNCVRHYRTQPAGASGLGTEAT